MTSSTLVLSKKKQGVRAPSAWKPAYPVPAKPVRVALVGMGYWGPNLLRNFQDQDHASVSAVVDLDESRLERVRRKFPGVRTSTDVNSLIQDDAIDAVVLATPVTTHFNLASRFLKAGKHVMVEKPLAASSRESAGLVALASKTGRVLMVGHTFEYNPAVLKVEELLKSKSLGKLHYIDAVRVNLGKHQADGQNVIWDLAPHDLSIILKWVGAMPLRLGAWGQSFIKPGVEDVAFIRLEFPGGVLAHIHVSWLAPAKIRSMTVVASQKMVLYDDLENSEKIKIADRGAHLDMNSSKVRVDYRLGDIVSPHVDFKEPLHTECKHFIDSILQRKAPLTDAVNGHRVVRILEAASQSLKKGGAMVSLKS